MQADALGVPVVRPAVNRNHGAGAAYLAGLASVLGGVDEISSMWPSIAASNRRRRTTSARNALKWRRAVEAIAAWAG